MFLSETEFWWYSIKNKKIIREFSQANSIKNEDGCIPKDYKIISSDKNIFVNCINGDDIFVFNYKNGELIKNLKRTSSAVKLLNRYAMKISSDSKYFAVVS